MAEDGLSFSSSFSLSIMGPSPGEAKWGRRGKEHKALPDKRRTVRGSPGADTSAKRVRNAAKLLERGGSLVGDPPNRLDQQDRAFAAADPHALAGGDVGPARDPFAVAELHPAAAVLDRLDHQRGLA